jgi:DNA primase
MDDSVDKIKQKLDVVDVIGGYVSLKKSGRNYKAVCPFHNEKTPSFMVSQELQIYKCFGCGASGDIFNFIQAIEGVDFYRSLEILADKAGVVLPKIGSLDEKNNTKKKIYAINDLTAKFYQYILLKNKVGAFALNYLIKDRGINMTSIKDFRIGYAPNSWDILSKFLKSKGYTEEELVLSGVAVKRNSGDGVIDKFRGRVIFPLISLDNKVVGFTGRTVLNKDPKYLNTSETPVFYKSSFIFGLNLSKVEVKKEGAVFVEGQVDVISSFQAGFKNVICISGTSLTDNQLDILSRYTNNITFCFDSDFAGIEASYRAIEMAEKKSFNIKVAVIPDPYKDIDELIKSDKGKAKKILKDPIPVYEFFLSTALKRNNKETALGKKAIMEELIPLFSKISNQVLFEHYTKKISSELDLSEETVFSLLRKGSGTGLEDKSKMLNEVFDKQPLEQRISTESYLIALLFKVPLDKAQETVEKLKKEDFLNPSMSEIFGVLKDYLKDRKTDINIKTLSNKFEGEVKDTVSELYLRDFDAGFGDNEKGLEKELGDTADRILKESVKRQLHNLSNEIRIAETKKEEEELKKLTKKFERLSKSLL